MSSYLIVAVAGSTLLLLALGTSVGLGWGLVAGALGGVLRMSLSNEPEQPR